ncbi:MAG: hypothetical protein N0A16_12905 [Blastocatellia bacterium]|nr:hypothetical protein [Blastocatellia bacterium]MCS7158606.1 hypothetical protein [Blastocatellia bacterium]MCX7753548.1 hypothetical protein [Blastocatellia bacterium]MDW8168180.1 hypothetical protein [Acidobacteriota bacterium]MDW8255403.1 hypothetical protein [Acidobacteriota bacterium]
MTPASPAPPIELVYAILCDDVRLEVGNKLTFVGVFSAILVPHLPATILKFAVVHHWRGEGEYLSEVRILSPDRRHAIAASHPASFSIPPGGYADNVTIFANVTFPVTGTYIVQTFVNATLVHEHPLPVGLLSEEGAGRFPSWPPTGDRVH